MALTRIEPIMQSLQDWVQADLDAKGYSGVYEMKDSFPRDNANPLKKTIIVLTNITAFPVRDRELGGPLVQENMSFSFDVFGATEKLGLNIRRQVEELLKNGKLLPLKDFSTASAAVVDKVIIGDVFGNRLTFADPRPWQQHWHSVNFDIEDWYNITF